MEKIRPGNVFRLLFCTVAAIFCTYGSMHAQFTIVPIDAASVESLDPEHNIEIPSSIRNDFFSPAKWRAERRAIRQERNNIEFNSTLDLAQTQFENWSSGGDNTFSARATLYYRHQYNRNRLGTDFKTEARYGFNRIERSNFKNEDEFNINFLVTWNMQKNWSYAASANFRSQFATGYVSRTDHTRKSTFMAPGFLDLAVGFTYINEPWNVVLSPVGGSAVFVLDDELSERGINGLDPGQRSKWKVGPSVRVNYDKVFFREIFRFRSEIYSFTNFKTAPLVRWENTFTIRATKFLSTTLYGLLYYDKESDTPRPDQLQFKYSISVGLVYNFTNK